MADSVLSTRGDQAEVAPPLSIAEAVGRERLIPLIIGLMLGMLLAALDQTVVGTAMPHIVSELGGGAQSVSWVYTAYLLASTVAVPIYGKLSDIYGRRIFFLAGMVVFLAGSALSGTSQDMTQLILYRAIQGLGAGALMPIAQAIIGDIFPPSERGKWQGLFMAVFGLATIVGPVLGGFITDNWGWRWVFYVNMPVGVFALLVAGLTMPTLVSHRRHHIDFSGSAALILWSVPLLLALSLGGSQYVWGSWQIISLFTVAAVVFVVFLVIELRAREPIISPQLFKSSIFTVSVVTTFLLSAGMFSAILYLPYFVQDVLGKSATNSGVILTPMMLGFIVSSLIGGQLLSRTGRYKLLALVGFAVAVVGMLLLSRMGISTTNGVLLRNMVITGLGIGVMMSLFTIVVQNAFPFRQLGEVTATLAFFRSMGGTIGLAVSGMVLANSLSRNLQANMPAALKPYISTSQLSQLSQAQSGATAAIRALLQPVAARYGPQQTMLLAQQLLRAVKISLAASISDLFLLGAAMMFVAFIITLFLREIPLRKSNRAASESPSSASTAGLDPTTQAEAGMSTLGL